MTAFVRIEDDIDQPRLVDNPTGLASPVLSFFVDYWHAKRGTADLPLRDSFVPREVGKHLQWVVTADALPEHADFRFRVVGSRVCDYFLGNGTGKTIAEAFADVDPQMAEGTLWLFRRACRKRIPLRVTGPASKFEGIYFPAYDGLCLPYSRDGATADRIVYIFTYQPRPRVALSPVPA